MANEDIDNAVQAAKRDMFSMRIKFAKREVSATAEPCICRHCHDGWRSTHLPGHGAICPLDAPHCALHASLLPSLPAIPAAMCCQNWALG